MVRKSCIMGVRKQHCHGNEQDTSKNASQSTINIVNYGICCKNGPAQGYILATSRQLWTPMILSAMLTLYSHPKLLANVKLTCRLLLVSLTVSKYNLEASLQSREDTRMTNTAIFSFQTSVYLKVFAALFFNKSTHYYIFQPVSFIHTIEAKLISLNVFHK